MGYMKDDQKLTPDNGKLLITVRRNSIICFWLIVICN